MTLPHLFGYPGGKSSIADVVWSELGAVDRYIEPFFGSGAVMFRNPRSCKSELINDKSHFIANLWRSIQHRHEEMLGLLSAPPAEVELKARYKWLRSQGARELQALDWDDLEACAPGIAAIWLWCQCAGISGGDGLHRADHGHGVMSSRSEPEEWLEAYRGRLRRVQILSGDWARCVTKSAVRGGRWAYWHLRRPALRRGQCHRIPGG